MGRAPGPNKYKGSLRAVAILAAILGVVSLAALGLTLNSGGPNALLSIVSKSGFPAAFALIFVSEIGDKVTCSILSLFIDMLFPVFLLDKTLFCCWGE